METCCLLGHKKHVHKFVVLVFISQGSSLFNPGQTGDQTIEGKNSKLYAVHVRAVVLTYALFRAPCTGLRTDQRSRGSRNICLNNCFVFIMLSQICKSADKTQLNWRLLRLFVSDRPRIVCCDERKPRSMRSLRKLARRTDPGQSQEGKEGEVESAMH